MTAVKSIKIILTSLDGSYETNLAGGFISLLLKLFSWIRVILLYDGAKHVNFVAL